MAYTPNAGDFVVYLCGERPGGIDFARAGAERVGMGQAKRIHTYDDELHERRRRLAIVRPPIDFEAARLAKLQERAKDTRDP